MNHSVPPTREITHIGHYAILDSIGRGGMGLVYLARDTRLDRLVAIKCLRSELIEPHYRERFKREALLLAKLNHPYIVQIYDFIETPEQLGLVMEFVDGQNLQRYLREQIVPFSQRMQWLTQIAQGLAVAHDAGIIHRDLKAENILINKRGEAKISDLGIAKSQDFNATLTEHVTGSYASMSPEQAVGEQLDFRSDLFSFGIIAYQLLCGAHPFGDTDNKLQLMQRIISHPPTSPSKHNPDLPPEICDLLGQLLSKNPDKRPANTHWLAAQCEKLSQLVLTSTLESDNTPALLHPASSVSSTSTTTSSHHGRSHSGIRKHYTGSTREHATFDTRIEKVPVTQKIRSYIKHHKTQISASCVILLIIAGITFWQLQPKQPRYIAVLSPTLTTSEMQESQQELVKAAVYDAIQQSVLQLDGYYLIPASEISDINAANNKEGLEIVRWATAADELITTNIHCKIEACSITLSRLTPDQKTKESRLRVQVTKTVDVLTDNYLSVASTVQNSIGSIYSENIVNSFNNIDKQEYATFLAVNRNYRESGAHQELLESLDKLQKQTKNLPATQTLYTEITLDLYAASKNTIYLDKLEKYLTPNTTKSGATSHLTNLYYFKVSQSNFSEAEKIIDQLKKLNSSNSFINELDAYKMMVTKDYNMATKLYQKALNAKTTANNLYYIAKAYWYSGNTEQANRSLEAALAISPNQHKAIILYGLIALTEGNLDQACSSFKLALSQNPNEIDNIGNFGVCNLLKGNYPQAIETFSNLSKLDPKNSSHKLNKADAENLAGKINESQQTYQDIINSISPENASSESLRHISQAYAHLGRFSEALTALQKLEKIDPQNIEVTYTAAVIHTLANNNASAIFNIENTLKNGMHIVWFNLSWFDSLCGDNKFISLMKYYGEPNRCTPLLSTKDDQDKL